MNRFVDLLLPVSVCSGQYDNATRTCGPGRETAYATLAAAAAAAVGGDNVILRGGNYQQALVPSRSGVPGAPISFRNYGSENPVITGTSLSPAIDISGRQYIIIEGLTIQNVNRWLHAVGSNNNVIRGNRFSGARDSGGSSKTGIFFERATGNRIENNLLEDSTQDHLSIIASDCNVVSGNTFRRAAHTLWTVKCGNYNVIRGNTFSNDLQKIGEVYDCDGVGFNHDITRSNATKFNLIEYNDFGFTPSSGNASPYAGIQYAAQNGVIRYNRFHDMTGPGLDLTLYSSEALFNTGNRVYQNVFYGTRFAGVSIASGSTFSGNIFMNNVLAGSRFVANDTRWPWYVGELQGKYVQLLAARRDGFIFMRNAFHGSGASGEPYLVTYGARDASNNGTQHSIEWWNSNYPASFRANLEIDPGFTDALAGDFRPTQASRLIDAGDYLTRTRSGGSGTVLPIDDASFFYDGFGIPGETGDMIRLEGSLQTARVTVVDRTGNALILDRTMTWTAGQGVHLFFEGSSPDIGAFEFPATSIVNRIPLPPQDLSVR